MMPLRYTYLVPLPNTSGTQVNDDCASRTTTTTPCGQAQHPKVVATLLQSINNIIEERGLEIEAPIDPN